jgi:hypothetical protein
MSATNTSAATATLTTTTRICSLLIVYMSW